MSIEIGLNPYLIETPFRLHWYLVLLLIGLILGGFIALKLAKRYGLTSSRTLFFLLAAIPGGLIGARLFHVADTFHLYRDNLILILRFWEGGFAQYGMILGGLATAFLYGYWRKLPFVKFLDLIPVPILIGLSIGRVGCVIQGCCYGSATSFPWGFIYTHPNGLIAPEFRGVLVHPTPVYEIICFLILAGILLRLSRDLQPIKGISFLFFLIGHSIERFLIFFVRGDYPELQIVAGLTQAQIIALVIFLISFPLLVIYWRKAKEKIKI